jgi:hypothetical protein
LGLTRSVVGVRPSNASTEIERAGEIDEERARRLRTFQLVVRDHALRDAGGVAQLRLRHSLALPERGEARAEAFQRFTLHRVE